MRHPALILLLLLVISLPVRAETLHDIATVTWDDGSVIPADLDEDGDIDLLLKLARYSPFEYGLVLVENLGGGSFADPVQLMIGGHSFDLRVMDVDGDGDLDIWTNQSLSNDTAMRWLRHQGNLTYALASLDNPFDDTDPRDLMACDYDDDSDLDFARVETGVNEVRVYVETTIEPGWYSTSLVFSGDGTNETPDANCDWLDADADGLLDLVIASTEEEVTSHTVCWNDTDDPFATSSSMGSGEDVGVSWTAELTGDGRLDLITRPFGVIHARLQQPDRHFEPETLFNVSVIATVTDYDGNGLPDIITTYNSPMPNTIAVHRQQDSGEYARVDLGSFDLYPRLGADLDGDGDGDLIGLDYRPGGTMILRWLENDGALTVDPGLGPGTGPMLPTDPALSVHPNPFNARATVHVTVPAGPAATLTMVDLLGRTTNTISPGPYAPGQHTITLDASSLPSGTYLLRLSGADQAVTHRITVVK